MEWQFEIIRALQSISNGFTDLLFGGITLFGDEIVLIAVAAVLYICFDKNFAYKLIMVFLLGSFVVDIMKGAFQVERPFFSDMSLCIGEPTEGFSFPSGHTMTAVVLYGMTAIWLVKKYGLRGKKKTLTYSAAGTLTFLVALSRMYLGQHFLTDVTMGFLVGAVTIMLFLLLEFVLKDREIFYSLLIVPALVLVIVFPGQKNYYMALGVTASMSLGYFLEKRYVRYSVTEKWWIQLIKAAVCLGAAFALKEGLKPLLELYGIDSEGGLSALIRYSLVGLWVSLGFMGICKAVIPRIFSGKGGGADGGEGPDANKTVKDSTERKQKETGKNG